MTAVMCEVVDTPGRVVLQYQVIYTEQVYTRYRRREDYNGKC